ncbi:MAG: hypothetical protein ABW170_23770 [Candidatus Thiodiazotropha sp. L084R]
MRSELAISPSDWLKEHPISIQNPASILSAFKPVAIKVVKFKGPHRLYRASGWDSNRGQIASAYGSWWADERVLAKLAQRIDMFKNWLPDELRRKALPIQYRGATALCEDWNDMREMFSLKLPAGQEITGLVGIASEQPKLSSLDPNSRHTPMLQGGAEQVYFKRTPTLNSVNPLWVYSEKLF